MAARLTDNEISRRLPLWHALSDICLDNEMQPFQYAAIARAAREGGYSLVEVRAVLKDEVLPALAPNLTSIAGEWSGFSTEAVREAILRQLDRPSWAGLLAFWMRRAVLKSVWPKIEKAIAEAG